ncbi:hypothetical protein GCM10010174_26120 [Kutzneria viridogrisea]|uniref:Uncharacterized protein n=1 Tax=Kutzneria viridogrisea TaxID=47990 RepID=A0ABR6BRJ3_9PSEU|nr:hypothetical protein [Kutzneria viridogrisea]
MFNSVAADTARRETTSTVTLAQARALAIALTASWGPLHQVVPSTTAELVGDETPRPRLGQIRVSEAAALQRALRDEEPMHTAFRRAGVRIVDPPDLSEQRDRVEHAQSYAWDCLPRCIASVVGQALELGDHLLPTPLQVALATEVFAARGRLALNLAPSRDAVIEQLLLDLNALPDTQAGTCWYVQPTLMAPSARERGHLERYEVLLLSDERAAALGLVDELDTTEPGSPR